MGADDKPLEAQRGIAAAAAKAIVKAQMLSVAQPAILTLRNRIAGGTALAPVRKLGDLPTPGAEDNLVWDARRALKRLLSLWAITQADYDATVAAWASKTPSTQLSGTDLEPLTKAIRKALQPTLANEVANSFLPLTLPGGQTVGAGCTNDPAQVAAVKSALGALFNAPALTSEPAGSIAILLRAIAAFKKYVAAGTLGWEPLRAEDDRDGGDKFGGRTYGPFPAGAAKFSVFVPSKAPPDKNFVHVFCSPGDVWGDGGDNNVLMQGVRSAFDQTKWIVISVMGFQTISTIEIQDLLKRINRASTTIDGLRFSAHSRGHATVTKSVTTRDTSNALLVDPSLVDLVTIFDASWQDLGNGMRKAGLASKVQLYDVTTPNQAGIKGTLLPFREGVRAIAFVRFIQDWMARDTLAPPADKLALANLLLTGNPPLPPRGGFTTQGAAGKVDFNGFCQAHAKDIAAITDATTGLGDYVRSSNLPQWFSSFRPDPIIEVHHYFVAELIHEAIGP